MTTVPFARDDLGEDNYASAQRASSDDVDRHVNTDQVHDPYSQRKPTGMTQPDA